MKSPARLDWLDKAIEIQNFHAHCCSFDQSWTVRKTAQSTNYSIGSISQYITIASWVKTHENQLRKCSGVKEAMEFIRGKQRELKTIKVEV